MGMRSSQLYSSIKLYIVNMKKDFFTSLVKFSKYSRSGQNISLEICIIVGLNEIPEFEKVMSCSFMRKQMEKLSALSLCVSSMFTTFQVIIKNALNKYSVTVNP